MPPRSMPSFPGIERTVLLLLLLPLLAGCQGTVKASLATICRQRCQEVNLNFQALQDCISTCEQGARR